ncbi:MAG: 2'-5' RNA ligase family protein [Saprospiraceae bacterium]
MKELLFFIALLPDEQIQQEVTAFKQYLARHFNATHALKSPPHITLFPPFKWQESRVNELCESLHNFTIEYHNFTLSLKNFSGFPPRVLFVDVEKSEALQALQRDLEIYLRKNLHLINERPHSTFNAHMTIAHKDLSRALYPQAWAHFSQQTYERTFPVHTITLLEHRRGKWEVYEKFEMRNLK